MTIRTVCAMLLFLAGSAVAAGPLPDGPYLSTSALATEEVDPDHARLQLNYRVVRETPEGARDETARAQRELLAVLQEYEDAIRSRRVESLTFGEATEYDPRQQRQVPAGFFGRFGVVLEVDDFDALPALHYALAGLQWESLGNPEFGVDEPERYAERVRARALAAARERAGRMAEAAGASLGPVWGIIHEPMHDRAGRFVEDSGPMAMSRAMADAPEAAFAMPLEPRPVRFEARVGVVYRIEP